MGLMKKIVIDGQEVAFRASAAIPRIYRVKFHSDIYKDLAWTISDCVIRIQKDD